MPADDETLLEILARRHYAAGDATRKSATYLREYQGLLEPWRERPLRLLELGVSSGASMLIWRDYLPQATIVGIDLADPPESIRDQERIHFLQGSQDDPETLDRAGEVAGGRFDLIIDDASHIGYLTKRSFSYLFPRWLVPGGTYIIEDFGTGFMPEYPDGARFAEPRDDDSVPETQVFASHQHGMVGVVKQFVDHLMTHLMTGQPPRYDIERMTILTNVAFLQKAGGAAARGAAMSPAEPGEMSQVLDQLPLFAAQLRRNAERLEASEATTRAMIERVAAMEGRVHDLIQEVRREAERTLWRRAMRRVRAMRFTPG